MDTKRLVWIGAFLGSLIGSFVPELWGSGGLSLSALVMSSLGAIVGVYAGFKLSR